ncbi:MAG TPA: thioredoxin domain-containing protein [Myxococcales bacterium]
MPTFRCSVCEAFNRLADAAPRRCAACESKLDVSGNPQEVDAAALGRAIARSPVPLFVDFWAPWCGPCMMAAPVVKALGSRMAGDIVVLSLNAQDAPEAAEVHAIYSLPTFAIFRDREEIGRRMGVLPRGETERWARRIIGLDEAVALA